MSRVLEFVVVAVALAAATARAETASYASYAGTLVVDGIGARFVPCVFYKGWQLRESARWGEYKPDPTGAIPFRIRQAKDVPPNIVGSAKFGKLPDGRVEAIWTWRAVKDCEVERFLVACELPVVDSRVTAFEADGKRTPFVETQKNVAIAGGRDESSFSFIGKDGRALLTVELPPESRGRDWTFGEVRRPARDNFILRFDVPVKIKKFNKGMSCAFRLILSAPDGLSAPRYEKVVVKNGEGWTRLSYSKDVIPGSALDFRAFRKTDAPAGKHGRVVVRNGRFEFEQAPGREVRFFGVNFAMSSNYPLKEQAKAIARRLAENGFNAVRIHHHENMWLENDENKDRLDFFIAALVEEGLYLTTDLYVSRNVAWKSIGVDRKGLVDFGCFKNALLFNEAAFRDLLSFTRTFLSHVNPYTGRSLLEEPALACLALVNESDPDYNANGWVSRMRTIPELKDKKLSDAFDSGKPEAEATLDLLAGAKRTFIRRMRKFVREELKWNGPITDMNAGSLRPRFQSIRRDELDYVDFHLYVDHPTHPEGGYSRPVRVDGRNPLGKDAWWRNCIRKIAIPGKPTVITEFKFCGPGHYRAAGEAEYGAIAARDGLSGLWQFVWTHSVFDSMDASGRPVGVFDACRDPLALAADRIIAAEFLRGDANPDVAAQCRTCGGFGRAGTSVTNGVLIAKLTGADATVYMTTLDGRCAATTGRVLVFHLTDVQGEGVEFADPTRMIALTNGAGSNLAENGEAEMTLRLSPGHWKVYAVMSDGSRGRAVACKTGADGALSFVADVGCRTPDNTDTPNVATLFYECVKDR